MSVLHTLGHIGLGALQVANVAGHFAPPPFNLVVAGGAAAAQYAIAAHAAKKAAKDAATDK